jgi:hypothetical protein
MGVNQVFMGLNDGGSLALATKNRALALGRPRKITNRAVLDYGDAFSHLNTGNRIGIVERDAGFHSSGSLGFEADAKILSLEYNDLSDKAPVNLEIDYAAS